MVKFNKSKKLIFLWLISFVTIFFINSIIITEVFKLIIPLTAILGFIIIFNYTNFLHTTYTSYFLFFLISLTSLLGFTKTLTGSHAESSNLILYGLSFYSASLAFLLSSHPKKINYVEAFKLTNSYKTHNIIENEIINFSKKTDRSITLINKIYFLNKNMICDNFHHANKEGRYWLTSSILKN